MLDSFIHLSQEAPRVISILSETKKSMGHAR